MFKRSRRTTVCKVEQLEGRVVPSAIVSKADVVGISSPILHLNGYTTFPVKPGETIDLVVVQIRNQSPITIAGRPTRVVVQPTSHPGDSGSFGAGIHVANDVPMLLSRRQDRTLRGDLIQGTQSTRNRTVLQRNCRHTRLNDPPILHPPESIPQRHLLATEHIRIELD